MRAVFDIFSSSDQSRDTKSMASTDKKAEIRRVSRIGLAKTFGWTVAEVDKMIELGCPYIKRAASKGDEWVFDTADVANWRLEMIRRGRSIPRPR